LALAARARPGGLLRRALLLDEALAPQLLGQLPHGRLGGGAGVAVAHAQVAVGAARVELPARLVAREVDLRQQHVAHALGLHGVQVAERLLVGGHGAAHVAALGQRLAPLEVAGGFVEELAHGGMLPLPAARACGGRGAAGALPGTGPRRQSTAATSMRLRPSSLARSSAAAAASTHSRRLSSAGTAPPAMPTEAASGQAIWCGVTPDSSWRRRRMASSAPGSPEFSTTRNSSPPQRTARSWGRRWRASRSASALRASSPVE